jgi:hypothetical protein
MNTNVFALASLAAGLLVSAPAVAGTTATITAEGQAMIKGGDEPAARDRALEDAQRKAVEQAVGTMISSETVMENYQIISDRILSQSKGYLKSYSIISSGAAGGTYKVTIKALVGTANLAKDVDAIKALLQQKNMPRVFIAVTEQIVGPNAFSNSQGGTANMGAVENALISHLRSKGFLIVDPDVLSGKIELSEVYKKGDIPTGVARRIGNLSGAEVVIFGKAMVQENSGPMLGKTRIAMGQVVLRAVNVQTGEVIATSNANGGMPTPANGLHQVAVRVLTGVGKKAGKDLVTQIVKQWQSDTGGTTRIVLTITGVKFRSAKALSKALSNMRGVKSVVRRSLKRGTVKLDVEVKASTDNFVNAFDGLKVGRKKIEITGVDGETVTATLGR